ncbi:MAG: signal peptidase I [Tissierellaceae bacterium]
MDGFGRSPYNHTIGGIIVNVIFVGTALVGRECLRGTLINSGRKQENIILFILVALLMTVVKYPITRYMTIRTVEGLIQFAAQHFLPNLTNSIFASYLVFVGGPLTSVIYLGMIEAFIWISPILPNLKWITSAFIGIMSPIFFMMFFSELPLSQESRQRKKEKYEDSTLSWVITTVVSIGLIWFAVGVFPVYPSVIATGSMKPIINPGDIILVKKITNTRDMEDIKEGDIIQFRKDSILISHRIIGIEKVGGGNIQFITKGDNNKEIDWEPVSSQNVKGMVKHILPKIGWPTLLIKGNRDIDIEKMGF